VANVSAAASAFTQPSLGKTPFESKFTASDYFESDAKQFTIHNETKAERQQISETADKTRTNLEPMPAPEVKQRSEAVPQTAIYQPAKVSMGPVETRASPVRQFSPDSYQKKSNPGSNSSKKKSRAH